MLCNRCTGIYKFGNNTYPQRIRRRSNLGHIFRGKKMRLMGREIRYLRLFFSLFQLEERQRREHRLRKESGIPYPTAYFKKIDDNWVFSNLFCEV